MNVYFYSNETYVTTVRHANACAFGCLQQQMQLLFPHT